MIATDSSFQTVPERQSSRVGNRGQVHIRKSQSEIYDPAVTRDQTSVLEKSHRNTYYPDTPYRTAIESKDPPPMDYAASSWTDSRRPNPREMQTDESIKVAAWDAYLQDFHQRKLNVRKSFIAPLKKRLTKEITPVEAISHDNSVPPFNSAIESDDVFAASLNHGMEHTQPLQVAKQPRARSVSDSLKSRLQKLMGKSKRSRTVFPAQHVEAQSQHYQTSKGKSFEHILVVEQRSSPSLLCPTLSPPVTVDTRQSSSTSSQSNGDAATEKSRVTSWTNSTGTETNRQTATLSSIDESGMMTGLENGTNIGSKQGRGSFLGRALRLPLRKLSTADLPRKSEDSQHLYEALQKQILGPDELTPTTMATSINDDVIATETVLKEYLPRRSHGKPADIPSEIVPPPTIRQVCSEDERAIASLQGLSESSQNLVPAPLSNISRKPSWTSRAKINPPMQDSVPPALPQPQHEENDKGARPSHNQLASRLAKSQNRWQSALEEHSPNISKATRYIIEEEDPYSLHLISATPVLDYLPVAVHHDRSARDVAAAEAPATKVATRSNIVSPSVYSRTEDYRSATPEMRPTDYGTFITITGREVKRYSLDSPSKRSPEDSYIAKPSHDWRAWLNTELQEFSATHTPEALSLTGHDESPDIKESGSLSIGSTLPHKSAKMLDSSSETMSRDCHHEEPVTSDARNRRPAFRNRRSSIMNERYPIVETGRVPSSERSQAPSSRAIRGHNGLPSCSEVLTDDRQISRDRSSTLPRYTNEISGGTPINASPRVRERHSTALLGSSRRRPSQAIGEVTNSERPTKASHKSAFDLRAVYRGKDSNGSSNIIIKRKPMSALLQDDDTLRMISEGPYRQSSATNKENDVPPSILHTGVIDKGTSVYHSSRPTSSRGYPRAPIVPANGTSSSSGNASPAQKMVDDWLSSKNTVSGPSAPTGIGSSPAIV
ncbi:hypothetical protein AAFC00_007006 [Neodothiora populina]